MAQGQIFRANASDQPAWSTATYPDTAGTSGNVLTSDGTNWSSSALSSSTSINGFVGTDPADPVDATTYYFAQSRTFIGQTASGGVQLRFYSTVAFTLNKVYANFKVDGTLGSSQNGTFFIRVNDTTNTNISTTVQLTAANNTVSTSSLGLSISAGDFFVFGFTCPTWTTNPTSVSTAIAFSS